VKRVFDYFEKLIQDKDDVLQEIGLTGIRNILGLEGDQPCGRAFYWSVLEKNKILEVIERQQNHAIRVSKLTSEILGFRGSLSEERNGD